MNKKLFVLSTLTLLLAACNPVDVLGPKGTLEGQVIAPGGFSVFSIDKNYSPVWNAPRRQGQVLVFSSSSFSAQSLSALSGLRSQAVDQNLTVVFTPVGQSDEAFAETLRQQGLLVQPNYLYQALGNSTPNDPDYGKQNYLSRINIPQTWAALEENKYNPSPVKIAVLDNNFNLNHPDLVGRFITGEARDFCPVLDANSACLGQDSDVTFDANTPTSERGHGTHSAGIIGAATNNGVGIAGITWSGNNILPIKVFGGNAREFGADTVALKRGIDWAREKGARVINLSLGIPFYQPNGQPVDGAQPDNYDPMVRISLQAAYEANIVVVAAAGNTSNEGIYYPASEGTVLAVGGVDANNILFSIGNFGSARPAASQTKSIDLVAPAVNIFSTDQDGAGAAYANRTGTSEAAPQVAGVAALLIAERPNATAREINLALTDGATNISSDQRNYGKGLLNAKSSLDKIRAGSAQPGQGGNGNQLNNFQYTVTVQAIRNNVVQATFNSILRSGESRVSYRFDNLPQGNYTLRATIAKPQPATGTRTVNLNSARVNIDICTDENGKNSCP